MTAPAEHMVRLHPDGPWWYEYAHIPIDGYGTATLGEWGDYLIQAMPMLFTTRIVMTRKGYEDKWYDHGWCFDKGMGAFFATWAWNPATEAEPAGYIKAVAERRTLPNV